MDRGLRLSSLIPQQLTLDDGCLATRQRLGPETRPRRAGLQTRLEIERNSAEPNGNAVAAR